MITPYLIAAIIGLVFGSFLTVCSYRIPYGRPKGPPDLEAEEEEDEEQESSDAATTESELEELKPDITFSSPKRSLCPHCKKQLHWYHNIPLFSWIFLGGRCAFCKEPVSIRYPLTEISSAFLCIFAYHFFGFTPTAALVYFFCATLVLISIIDIEYYIIPDVISIPGTFLGIAVATLNQFFPLFAPPVADGIVSSLLGVLAGGGFLFFIATTFLVLRGKRGLGLGDVKLLALVGAFFGPECALYTIFVGSLFGSIFGILLMCFSGFGYRRPLPFGPYLALATALYLFTGLDLLILIRMLMMLIVGLFH